MKKILLTISLFVLFGNHLFAQIADSSKREVRLEGASNFRDIGGYETKDGKHVQ